MVPAERTAAADATLAVRPCGSHSPEHKAPSSSLNELSADRDATALRWMTYRPGPPRDTDLARLEAALDRPGGWLVAFSGGVDSGLVAAVAHRLHPNALAVTASSPSLSAHERRAAETTAAEIGIRHRFVETREWQRPGYRENTSQRCWHCKHELYATLGQIASHEGLGTICNGTNLDDLGEHRPGLEAAREAGVVSPLVDAGLDKARVRRLARLLGLSVSDKPASPCLASRIAFGLEATPERLARVERAEAALRSLGLDDFRVRHHQDDLARVEVPAAAIPRLATEEVRRRLTEELLAAGFRYVTLDLEGLRSGSLHATSGGPLAVIDPPAADDEAADRRP